jgi:DHA1 family bicyclomycin/chloramphenicol resistance-like MFS transporter
MHTLAQRPSRLLPVLLAGLAMVGPFSIDAIFPGFPDLKHEFNASPVATLVFVVASVGVAISHALGILLICRFIQGCSAGGGVVVGRAIIRDVASGPQAQKMISSVMMIFGVAPAIAPVAGALLLNLGGWRATFWAVAFFALFLVAICQLCLKESLPRERRQPLAVRSLLATYFRIYRSCSCRRPEFWRPVFIRLIRAPVYLRFFAPLQR